MSNYFKHFSIVFLFFLVGNTHAQIGIASYYSDKFQGAKTASGELYDKNKLTAAHNEFPFGTVIRVTRLDNNKSVEVRVNDRGPYYKGRIVDISRAAAERIGLITDGTAEVRVEKIGVSSGDISISEEDAFTERETERFTPPPVPEVSEPVSRPQTKPTPKPTPKAAPKKPVTTTPKTAKAPTSTKKDQVPSWPKKKDVPTSYEVVKGGDYKTFDLYKVQVLRPKKEGYGVQVASLTIYENVLKQVAELQEKWFDNILISVEEGASGKATYKIILGPFPDRETADSYKKNAKSRYKVDGFVVDLSSLQ